MLLVHFLFIKFQMAQYFRVFLSVIEAKGGQTLYKNKSIKSFKIFPLFYQILYIQQLLVNLIVRIIMTS